MKQQVETTILNLQQLLALNLNIPEYQRPYTWTSKNVVQLLDDVVKFAQYPEYRMGTVILHDNQGELDIVDGQQRILTSLLIARALKIKESLNAVNVNIPMHEKTLENVQNNFKVIEEYFERNTKAKDILEEYFLEHCTVLVLTLNKLDEAFQLFDSSNNRGKALYPTDLLKAYHLRELTGNEAKKLQMVELWENIKPSHIYELFSEYFYRIKQWSRNKRVSDAGFTNQDLDLFKGVSEANDNKHNQWAKSLLMAKNYVDTYNRQNHTMIEFKAMEPLHYPFQIDQPMINGEYFFKFVEYYYQIAKQLGFWEEGKKIPSEATAIAQVIDELDKYHYFRYVISLYRTTMLYVVDKFSADELPAIEKICFKYALYPRFDFEQVQKKTINKFVLDSRTGVENFFHYVNESFTVSDVLRFDIDTREELFGNANKVKEKSATLHRLYFKGGN